MAAIALFCVVGAVGIGPCSEGENEAAPPPKPQPTAQAADKTTQTSVDGAPTTTPTAGPPTAARAPGTAARAPGIEPTLAPLDTLLKTPRPRPLSPGARLEDERNTIDVFEAAASATVYVTQKRIVRDLNMRPLEQTTGSGTGFLWDDAGHVVTNYHVIDTGRSAGAYAVTLYNQRTYDAVFVGGEPNRDIAVLKIDAPKEELTPIQVEDGDARIDVGQKTIAIGNPFGLDHTLTTGVVSAKGREVVGYGGITIRDMIQTDASINPGNSGGPLLDSSGRLIGMNTMIMSKTGSSAGIGFAVPVTTIRRIVPQLIEHGKIERAGIGITFLDDSVAARAGVKGVIITGVMRGSPAAAAGLLALRQTRDGRIVLGDILVGIDESTVENYDDLYNALERYKAGDSVSLKIRRGKTTLSLPIKLTAID